MNLLEAIETGKPFRRKEERSWRQPHHAQILAPADLTATDWEIEEIPLPITESQFFAAYTSAVCDVYADAAVPFAFQPYIPASLAGRIAKKLGF